MMLCAQHCMALPSNTIAGSRGFCGAHQWWTNAEPQIKGKKNLVEHVQGLSWWWRWYGRWWWRKLGPPMSNKYMTYCDYILAVPWLFLPSNTGCGKEEVLFCWPLIKTVLTPEWSVSSRSMVCKYLPLKPWLQRFKILGYRCSSYSKEIRNTIPRVFSENMFVGS